MILRIFYECDKKNLKELANEVEQNLRYISSCFGLTEWHGSYNFKPTKSLSISNPNELAEFALLKFLDSHKPDYNDGTKVTVESAPEISSSIFFTSKILDKQNFKVSFNIGGNENNVGLIVFDPIENLPSLISLHGVIEFVEYITTLLTINRIEIYDSNFTSKILQTASNEIELGWIVFLSNKYKMPILSPEFQLFDIGNGKLIIVTDGPFNSNNPIHCNRVKSIREAFVTQKIFIIKEGEKPPQKSGYELFLESLMNSTQKDS